MSDNRKPRAFAISAEKDEDEAPKAKSTRKPDSTATKDKPRTPRATPVKQVTVREINDYFDAPNSDTAAIAPPAARLKKPAFKLGKLAIWLFGTIISLSFGLWLDALVRDLLERNTWLGNAALALIALFLVTILALIARELMALRAIKNVSAMRAAAEKSIAENDQRALAKHADALLRHFADDPRTAAARNALAAHQAEIMDGMDRYTLAERDLLSPLDREARQIVMNAAKRVSVVTAVSPRALVDIGYVLYENVRLIRVMAEHYGGRTGFFGTFNLARRVLSHLAVTGTIALGDSLMQQIVGHGLAARLSARLGEGVVNGLMTARVGIAAIDVCRPAPFHALARPKVGDMVGALLKSSPTDAAEVETKENTS